MIRSYSNYSQNHPNPHLPALSSISTNYPIPLENLHPQDYIEPSLHFLEEKFIPEISNIIISYLNFKDLSVLAQVNRGSNNLISSQLIYREGKANQKTDKLIRFFKNFTI